MGSENLLVSSKQDSIVVDNWNDAKHFFATFVLSGYDEVKIELE